MNHRIFERILRPRPRPRACLPERQLAPSDCSVCSLSSGAGRPAALSLSLILGERGGFGSAEGQRGARVHPGPQRGKTQASLFLRDNWGGWFWDRLGLAGRRRLVAFFRLGFFGAGGGANGHRFYYSLWVCMSVLLPRLTSDQARLPAEFKHITKRRKRN